MYSPVLLFLYLSNREIGAGCVDSLGNDIKLLGLVLFLDGCGSFGDSLQLVGGEMHTVLLEG